jgi:hypothetical protein
MCVMHNQRCNSQRLSMSPDRQGSAATQRSVNDSQQRQQATRWNSDTHTLRHGTRTQHATCERSHSGYAAMRNPDAQRGHVKIRNVRTLCLSVYTQDCIGFMRQEWMICRVCVVRNRNDVLASSRHRFDDTERSAPLERKGNGT